MRESVIARARNILIIWAAVYTNQLIAVCVLWWYGRGNLALVRRSAIIWMRQPYAFSRGTDYSCYGGGGVGPYHRSKALRQCLIILTWNAYIYNIDEWRTYLHCSTFNVIVRNWILSVINLTLLLLLHVLTQTPHWSWLKRRMRSVKAHTSYSVHRYKY